MKQLTIPLLLAAMLAAPTAASAETHEDVYNGATCIPYPMSSSTSVTGLPYSSFLYGFRQSAFCHITMPGDWRASQLSYVVFVGSTSTADPLRVRLCLYDGLTSTCGAERTISGSFGANWVAPPTPPSYVSGAYLSVRFADGAVATFQQFIPVWSR